MSTAEPLPRLISVVIPCRDASAWLDETLTSVLTQTDVDFEVIVVDDGSTDESVAIAECAGDARVRVLRQPPLGVSHARNQGTAVARGEFLQYLDADDVLTPGTLARRRQVLDELDADVAVVDWVRWEEQADGTLAMGEEVVRELGTRPDIDLLTDAWWPPGAVMYRRQVVEAVGAWRTDLPIIQDARFLLDAALAGARFTRVAGRGLQYRVRAASLSRRDPWAFLTDCWVNATDVEDRWRAMGALDAARGRALVQVYAHLARQAFTQDRARFDAIVSRIRRLEPRFHPASPPSLRMLSRVAGYERAEQVAAWWHALKGRGR